MKTKTSSKTHVISTNIGPKACILSILSYRFTHPSSVLGGKNSKETQFLPSFSACKILEVILTIFLQKGRMQFEYTLAIVPLRLLIPSNER